MDRPHQEGRQETGYHQLALAVSCCFLAGITRHIMNPLPKGKSMNDMKKSLAKLKAQFEENPTLVIGVASGAVLATAKLVSAVSETRNSKTWRQEVQRRGMKDAARRR